MAGADLFLCLGGGAFTADGAVIRRLSTRAGILLALTGLDVAGGLWMGGLQLYPDGLQSLWPTELSFRFLLIFMIDAAIVSVAMSIWFAWRDKGLSLRTRIFYGTGVSPVLRNVAFAIDYSLIMWYYSYISI